MQTRRQLLTTTLGGLAVARVSHAGWGWIPLIGKRLTGWKAEGKADWCIQGGCIVGTQGQAGEGGDLFTEQQWTDFELRAEWKMRWPGNSGIWFRWSGPKTGYQADFLDQPSHPGVLSGSLYCMGKAFIAENRDPATVNKDGWNRLNLRVQGDLITVVQNGTKVVEIRDKTFPGPGSIGIQVHQGKPFEGMEIRVRRLEIRPL